MSPVPFSELVTPGGYAVGEVSSALQKCVRRGLEEDAVFWATELDLAGFGNYAFKRLTIMASEDVGLADPMATVIIRTLWGNYTDQRKNKADKGMAERLYLVHAVIYLAKAPKSRRVDNATVVMYHGPRAHRPIPDVALDKHTKRGRQMGRGFKHFFAEGAQLANEASTYQDDPNYFTVDPYHADAVRILTKAPADVAEQLGLSEGGGEQP